MGSINFQITVKNVKNKCECKYFTSLSESEDRAAGVGFVNYEYDFR